MSWHGLGVDRSTQADYCRRYHLPLQSQLEVVEEVLPLLLPTDWKDGYTCFVLSFDCTNMVDPEDSYALTSQLEARMADPVAAVEGKRKPSLYERQPTARWN